LTRSGRSLLRLQRRVATIGNMFWKSRDARALSTATTTAVTRPPISGSRPTPSRRLLNLPSADFRARRGRRQHEHHSVGFADQVAEASLPVLATGDAVAVDEAAMSSLARLYYGGQGVPDDYAKAREWFEKAAVKGDASAMASLAWLYSHGPGVGRDYTKA
jgi:TPR repeat protein